MATPKKPEAETADQTEAGTSDKDVAAETVGVAADEILAFRLTAEAVTVVTIDGRKLEVAL